jgi:hypothetical protein
VHHRVPATANTVLWMLGHCKKMLCYCILQRQGLLDVMKSLGPCSAFAPWLLLQGRSITGLLATHEFLVFVLVLLQVYQSVSGLHHPDTFNCLTLLVSLLRSAGKAMHALPLAQRCLAVKKKSLGELHPDTAASMQVVADVMLDLGR